MGYYDDLLSDYRRKKEDSQNSQQNVSDYYKNLLSDYRSGNALSWARPTQVNAQSDPYNDYLNKLDQTYKTHNTAYQALEQKRTAAPAIDPDLAGYATDPLAIEQLRTNGFTLKDALQQITEGTKAEATKQEYTQLKDYKTYTDKLNTYKGDSEAMYQDYNKRIQELEKQYQTSPGTWRETRRQVKALEKERDWLKSYGDSLKQSQEDAALVDAWAKGHGGNYESYQEARNRLQAAEDKITRLTQAKTNAGANDYSGYATDELGQQILAQQQATGSTWTAEQDEELRAALKERDQARKILNYASQHQTDELSKRPDYDRVAAEGESRFQTYKQQQTQERTTIETNPYAPATVNPYDPTYYSEFREPDNRWTEEEKKNFYYLFATDRDWAYRYGAEVEQRYNAEDARRKGEATAAKASRSFVSGVGYSAASVPANLVGGLIDYAKMGMEYAARGDIYETQYQGGSLWAENVRGGIAQKLNESGTISDSVPVLGGKGLGDLYQLMMSMADSSVSVMAGGGAANVVFFGSAAASTTRQALERGVSGGKAVALGFAAGAAEVAGEMLSVEHLLKQGDVADYLRKGLLREMAKQGGVEASEEVLTTILNTLADAVINGDESEFQQKVYAYVADGMGYNDAVRKARIEWIEGLGEDALGGFLSGGLMSGGRLALQGASAAMTTYEGDTKGLFQRAALAEEGGKTASLAKQYQQQLEKKGSISNLQAARLQANLSGELNAKDRPQIERDLRKKLSEDRFSYLSEMEKDNMVERVLDEALNGSHEGRELNDLEQRFADEIVTQLQSENVPTGNWIETKALKNVQDAKIFDERFKTVELKEGGDRVSVKSAKMDDGKLTFTYEQNGQEKEATLADLKLDSYQAQVLKEMTERLGEDAASAFNSMRPGQFRFISDVTRFANAFATVRDIFGTKMTDENADRLERAALDSPLRRGLTDGQVLQALDIGRQRGRQVREQIKSARGAGEINMNGVTIKGENGKDITLNGLKNQEKVKLSKKYKLIQGLAKAFGIDMVLYDSEDGKTSRLNGAYQDGVIYLDWSALQSGDKKTADWVMFRTLAHELTHFIQQNATEEYQELKEFVTDYLAKSKDLDFNELVEQKMAREERQLTYEEAVDEVVADACETMLRDSEYVQQMMEEKPGLFQAIRNWIRKVLRRIEAQDDAAKELQPVVNELRALWDKGLRTAVESRETGAQTNAELGVVEETNSQGQTTAVESQDTGKFQMSLKTYNEGGKQALSDFLDKQVEKGALTKEEAAGIRTQMQELYKICKSYDNGRYAPFSAWSNASVVTYDGRPVFSVVKANGEYKLNLDFSLVCKKRRTLDAVFNEMISQGIMDDFNMFQESIAKINDIIRDNGFETACGLCFVDSKRYRQAMIADAFTAMYNMQVMSLVNGKGQKVDYFNYGGDKTLQNTGRGIDTLPDSELDWTKINKILQTEKSSTVKWKIANYLKNNPSARKRVMRGDFMSTAGFDALKAKNPELLSLYNSKKGAGGPKAAQSDVQYLNDIINSGMFNQKAAYEVGGVRIQSFSDYVGRLVFDYVQMVGDLAAKKLPAHSYTKEFMFAQQFGLTGIKINMSLVPEIIKDGVAPGLDANGNYAWKDGQSFGSTVYDNKGKRLTAAEGFELAKRIQNADGYSKNCGTIAVGVSDAHIRKMLDDPEIRMIIPYHKSSLNHIVAAMMNIDKYHDYTLQQNTREKKNGKLVNISKSLEFNFNEALQRLDDARAAANEYLAWCDKNGYTPKFDQFRDNANYYKLLEDYSCYDRDGTTNAPMGAVQMKFPTATDAFGSMSELIEQGLEEDAILQAKQEQAVPEIVKQIQAVLPEFEGTVRERNAKKGSKKAATTGGRVQFAVRQNPRTVTTKRVEELVQNCLFGRYEKDKYIPVRSGTPQFFIDTIRDDSAGEVEIAELPWAMPVWHVQQEVEDQDERDMEGEATPHAFLPDEFAEVIERTEKPNKIILQNNGNYAMMVRHRSKAGKDIAVVISVGPDNNGRYIYPQYMVEDYDGGFYNIAVTSYAVDSFDQYLKKYVAEDEQGRTGRIIYDKDANAEVGSGSTVPSRISGLASSETIVPDTAEESKRNFKASTKNLGYHAGDLGKAEHLNIQGRYRGTGHFGTGTYFVGEEEKVTKDSHYGKRPQHAVDFTDYNLFKVRSDRTGYQLHDALRIIDGGIKREWIRPAMENQFNIISPTGYYDLARSKYGENWALGDNLRNAMLEYAANNGISIQTLDEFKKEHGFEADDPDAGYYYDDYVQETLKEEIGKVNDEYREFMDAVFDLHILPGFSNSKIFSALQAVADYQDATPRDARADSYATTFMKAMGYDGVDVRGTGLDNTQYGSVIYDVKPATIAYSMRSDAKTDRELLKAAYQDLVQKKQSAINELQAEQKKALEDFNKAADRYAEAERKVSDALDELDKLVQRGDDEAARKQRTKVTAYEKTMANALQRLTQVQESPEIQSILRQERAIQRERTTRKLREAANRRELRQRINKLWKDLNAKTVKATKDKRVPKELMQQAVDVLAAINMDNTREGSKAGEKLRSKLLELKQKYEEIKNDADFDKAAIYDPIVAELMQKMVAEVGDTPINKMTAAQLETVYNTLKALDVTARKALKIQLGEEERDAYEAAMEMTKETRMRGKKTGAIHRYLNAQLSPERMFRQLGGYTKDSTWEKVYDMLNAGQLRQTRLQVEGSMIFEDLLESKDYAKFIDPKNLVDIGLKDENGKTIQITHGMLVSLYMHLMNEQNARHVAWGGLTIPALADYYNGKKAKGSENAVRVGGALQEVAEIRDRLRETEDEAEIAELEARLDELQVEAMNFVTGLQTEIEKNLTDYDRQWIAACRELFDEFTKRELNATTMDVYGIKRANVENYFPIWVDGDFLNTPFESVARDMSLENVGFMKERVDSSKPIRLADVSDVAASQIRKVAQYCGMMPAIRDFDKIWGKTQTGYRDSLRKAVHESYGESGVKYIKNLMADLNGARGASDTGLGEFLNRMRGHMAQASLTLSLRTALGQMASYPTAASVLGWDALRKGLAAGKVDRVLIQKWSPLLAYRMKGFSTAELGDIAGMNDKLTRLWRKARWATGWIQAMDGFTVGRLWPAAEAWVQANRKDLAKGTDAYYEAVAAKFNEAIEATQPNYSAMQRPDILRNPNALVRQLTMFLTQRLQNFNILYDAAANYSAVKADFKAKRNGVTAEDVRQAAVQTRTAAVSQAVAGATIVAFKALADFLLHSMKAYRDDDEELTAESISLELLDMFLDSLAGNVLGGSEAYDLIESKVFGKTYYGIDVSGVSTVKDLIDAVSKVYDHAAKAVTDENTKYSMDQLLSDLDLLAKRFGPVAGIPYSNAKKVLMSGVYWTQDALSGQFLEAGVDRTTTQQANRLLRAYQGMDYAKVEKIRGEVPEDKQKDLDEAVRKAIKNQYKKGEITEYEAIRQLEKYGNAGDQALANFIKDEYKAGNIQKGDAVKQLMQYCGKDQKAAEKTIRDLDAKEATGLSYSDIDDAYELGDITAAQARDALVKYGLDKDKADMKVEYWTYRNAHPGTSLTDGKFETYWKNYHSMMTPAVYEDFKLAWDAVPGTDKDHDGKADANSKKPDRIKLIDSLPITKEQKDILFQMEWKTGLEDAPWHT